MGNCTALDKSSLKLISNVQFVIHTINEIIYDFPELTEEDIKAYIAYATDKERILVICLMKIFFD